jgi:hypothetical protein
LLGWAELPGPESVGVQRWFGESAWQGEWLPLNSEKYLAGDQIVVRLAAMSPPGGSLLSTISFSST